jgi:primosomal protein N' (replication factor Y)
VLRFPPHYRLAAVLGTGPDEEQTASLFKEFTRMLRNAAFRYKEELTVLGPVPAPIARINDQYRWRLLLRGRDHRLMKNVLDAAFLKFADYPGKSKIQMITDIDPMDLL